MLYNIFDFNKTHFYKNNNNNNKYNKSESCMCIIINTYEC